MLAYNSLLLLANASIGMKAQLLNSYEDASGTNSTMVYITAAAKAFLNVTRVPGVHSKLKKTHLFEH